MHSHLMPSVKAYELENTVIVKFYDDGVQDSLHCPACTWSGNLEETTRSIFRDALNVKCPCCETTLGLIHSDRI